MSLSDTTGSASAQAPSSDWKLVESKKSTATAKRATPDPLFPLADPTELLEDGEVAAVVMVNSKTKAFDPAKFFCGEIAELQEKDLKDIWMHILAFVGPGHFIYVAGVSRQWKKDYQESVVAVYRVNPPPMVIDHIIRLHLGGRHSPAERPAISSDTFYRAAFFSIACAEYWKVNTQRGLQPHSLGDCVARFGKMEVLQWAQQQGFELDEWACHGAAWGRQLENLKWLHDHDSPWDEDTCSAAALNGDLEILKYAHENNCPWDRETCREAASNGHLECLKYAHENSCPWDDYTTNAAAENGHLECLKYAHESNCPWDDMTCWFAMANGHLECLKYAHENDSPWGEETCYEAAKNGKLECLQYARDNGCPFEEDDINILRWYAERYQQQHVLDWLDELDQP